MSRADQSTSDILTEYFAVMEAKDYERLAGYYADDITLTFANAPTVKGKDHVLAQMAAIGGKVKSLAHPLVNVWQEEDGVVVFEVDSAWRFLDGVELTIRACSIFTISDGKFTDQRIYVDNTPINSYLSQAEQEELAAPWRSLIDPLGPPLHFPVDKHAPFETIRRFPLQKKLTGRPTGARSAGLTVCVFSKRESRPPEMMSSPACGG
jgi:ketosteroid isomerase-like protein